MWNAAGRKMGPHAVWERDLNQSTVSHWGLEQEPEHCRGARQVSHAHACCPGLKVLHTLHTQPWQGIQDFLTSSENAQTGAP